MLISTTYRWGALLNATLLPVRRSVAEARQTRVQAIALAGVFTWMPNFEQARASTSPRPPLSRPCRSLLRATPTRRRSRELGSHPPGVDSVLVALAFVFRRCANQEVLISMYVRIYLFN